MARLHPVPGPWCPRCGLTRIIPGPTPDGCSACHGWPSVLPKAGSACLHTGGAAELVRGLKYRGWTALADPMAERMLPAARRVSAPGLPFLVPVPMTRAKRRERGFNQAQLLARSLSLRSGWPVEALLIRTGGGPPLARLGRTRREEAVRRAFTVRAATAGRSDRGRAGSGALLVDDVITTGATAAACAEALAAAGVRCCGVVSFSRADPLDDIG